MRLTILSALAVALLTNSPINADESLDRAKSTLRRMQSVGTAIAAYMTDYNKAPEAASIDALVPLLVPAYATELAVHDGWDTPLRYVRTGAQSFQIVSAGADQKFDERTWSAKTETANLDADVVFSATELYDPGDFERIWTDRSGNALDLSEQEAQARRRAADPEEAARKAMLPAARMLLERADAHAAAGDFAGALQAYMEAVKTDRAAADLERLRRYHPPFPTFTVSETRDAAEDARIAKALEPYIAALRQHFGIHPDDMEALGELVDVLEPKDADAVLAPLIQARPRYAELYALRAKARAKASQWQAALADFEKARDLDPSNAERHYIAGVVAYEAVKGESNLTPQKKQEVIPRGIAALERAEGLRDGYFEAMVYRSLLIREQARWVSDSASQAKLIAEADALRERAKSLVMAKRSPAAPAAAAAEVPEPQVSQLPGGPFRVGGDVKAPVLLTRVEPIYPEEARAHRIAGIVIVEVVIDKSGRVVDAKELKGLPYGAGEAALDAVRQWTFRPGTLDGQPVDVIFNLTVSMRLPL